MKLRRLFFWLFFGVLAFGQLERFQVTESIGMYLHDFLVVAFIAFTFFTNARSREKMMEKLRHAPRAGVIVVGWIALGFACAWLVRNQLSLSPILYLGRLLSYGAFWWCVWQELQRYPSLRVTIQWCLCFFFLSIGWFGVLQYLLMPDMRFLFLLGWDDHYYRLVSTLLDPAFTGIILVLGFWFWQSIRSSILMQLKKSGRVTHFLVSLGFLATILLTYSRASYLALVFPMILTGGWYMWQKKWRALSQVVLFALLFFVAVPFLPKPGGEGVKLGRTSTIITRTTMAENLVRSLHGYEWIVGKGIFIDETTGKPGEATVAQQFIPDHSRVADNWVLFFLSGTGIVGLIVFVLLGLKGFRVLLHRDVWASVSLISILVHGFFNASVIYPFVVLAFGGMVTLVLAQHEEKTTPRKKL